MHTSSTAVIPPIKELRKGAQLLLFMPPKNGRITLPVAAHIDYHPTYTSLLSFSQNLITYKHYTKPNNSH